MLGLQIATLVLVCVHLGGYIYLNFWAVVQVKNAISRQDDRLRKRAERQVVDEDEDSIGRLVEDLQGQVRQGYISQGAVADVLARHPDARLPEEL